MTNGTRTDTQVSENVNHAHAYKRGAIVRIISSGVIGVVLRVDNADHTCLVSLTNQAICPLWYRIEDLEPYSEPSNVSADETKDDTKESVNLSQNTANCDKPKDNQLKDNMEEKELNLCELLKGCEGEKFYSPLFGECSLIRIKEQTIILEDRVDGQAYELYQEGYACFGGVTMLYPSRTLYEKYPLDAYSAWMKWNEARKPKYVSKM